MKRTVIAAALVSSGLVLHAQIRTLITASDLTWLGSYAFPSSGTQAIGGPGSTAYSFGGLAVRYVNGERRFLVPNYTNVNPTTGQAWGDLVEWKVPATAPYTGTTPASAPALIETRRWSNWTALFAGTSSWWSGASGVRIGGLLWDEAQGVLWYELYGYYDGSNHPFLGAVQLLDTAAGPGYATVGPSYGPWWYRDIRPSDSNGPFTYWKQVAGWFIRIPASAQPDLQGRSLIAGAGVGAVGGSAHLGPGFSSITTPALTDPPNSVLALGQRLADYSPESNQGRREARRTPNYTYDGIPQGGTGLQPVVNGIGRWQMSLDQVNSFIWVETPTKEGILMFGRQAQGITWYGFNPRSKDPHYTSGPDALDPTRPNGDSNGYGAAAWGAALYVYDPAQVREVGRGARSPFSDGMSPVATYDWHAKWPNLALSRYEQAGLGTPQSRPISSFISNTGYWDPIAQQIVWIQPMVINGNRPMLNLFTVSGGTVTPPQTPTNVVIKE